MRLMSPSSPGEHPQFPVLEGLSDQTPGVWAYWEHPTEANSQAIFGVQRDIAELAEFANKLPDIIRSTAEAPTTRPDESLVEWYIADQPLAVDLTLVLAVLGRDLRLIGVDGRLALEGA